MLDKSYIKRIHMAKNALKLDEQAYYAMLSIYGVETSIDLTEEQAKHLLNTFRKMGWEPGKKYNALGARPAHYATPRQLRYIEALWMSFARVKTSEALRKFVKRQTGKDSILYITKKDASSLIKALITMQNDYLAKQEILRQHKENCKDEKSRLD